MIRQPHQWEVCVAADHENDGYFIAYLLGATEAPLFRSRSWHKAIAYAYQYLAEHYLDLKLLTPAGGKP